MSPEGDRRETRETDAEGTRRLLVGLTLFAILVTLTGIGVVWALTYGPLG